MANFAEWLINDRERPYIMGAIEELDAMLRDPARKLVVSADYVDLASGGRNELYIMLIEEAGGAAGGRAGGFGGRSIRRVYHFICSSHSCEKPLETESDARITSVDIPAGIARLPAVLLDGAQVMIYGVVDPDAVKGLNESLMEGR